MASLATELKASSSLVDTLNSTLGRGGLPSPQGAIANGKVQRSINRLSPNRVKYLNRLNEVRDYWLVKVIYDLVAPDIIPDSISVDDQVIQVTSSNDPEIGNEITKLFRNLNIEEVLRTILPDLLHYGSYPLLPVVRGRRGVVDIIDEYDPFQVISITDSKINPLMFFVDTSNTLQSSDTLKDETTAAVSFEYLSIAEIVQFNLGVRFNKINLGRKVTTGIKSSMPTNLDYVTALLPDNIKIRQSVSFIDSVLDKIEELYELDPLLAAKSAASLLRPDLVGIPLPNDYDPLKSTEVVQKYQQLLNKRSRSGGSFKELLNTVGELQPVPIVGDRSVPQHIDLKDIGSSRHDSDNFQDAVKSVLSALGISPEYLYGEMRHGENFKSNVRHARRVKKIQSSLTRTLSKIAMIHLANKFPEKIINESDFTISIKNTVNLDELEALETQDMVLSTLRSTVSVIEELSKICDGSEYVIDKNRIIESMRDALTASGSRFSLAIMSRGEVKGSTEPVAPMRSGDDF